MLPVTFLWQGSAPHFYHLSTISSHELITRSIYWLDQNLKIQPRLKSPSSGHCTGDQVFNTWVFWKHFMSNHDIFSHSPMLSLIIKNAFSPDPSVPKVWTVSSSILQNQIQSLLWDTRQTPAVSPWKLEKKVFPKIIAQSIAIPERRTGHRKEDSDQIKNMTWKGRCSVLGIHIWPWGLRYSNVRPERLGSSGQTVGYTASFFQFSPFP